jgi:hypothetical protein
MAQYEVGKYLNCGKSKEHKVFKYTKQMAYCKQWKIKITVLASYNI